MKTQKHFTFRMRLLLATLTTLTLPAASGAQYNCSIYKDSSQARACRLYNAVDSFYQGSPMCQHYLDSAIAICPGFAPAWREKAVPYLKRGDFVTWRRLMDTAVKLDPMFLAYRGWCRFEFLRDYRGALEDLQKFDTLSGFSHTESNNGDYELHIAMALCQRELNNIPGALHYFNVAFENDSLEAGLYGYLHLGVTRLIAKDYDSALTALEHENRIYDKFAESWYYLALTYTALGDKPRANEYLLHARRLLTDSTGRYHLHEVYCEMPDAIYLPDVERALNNLNTPRDVPLTPVLNVPLNVHDFGARGDGITDDTHAINTALTAAHTQRKSLFFPPGTYVCNKPDQSGNLLTFDAGGLDNISIAGTKATITTRQTSGTLLYIYAFSPSAGLTIKGLRLISTHPRTNENTTGLFMAGTPATNIRNTELINCVFSGFALDAQGQGIKNWVIKQDSFYAPNGHDDAFYGSNSSHPAVNLWFPDNKNGTCYNVEIERCWASGYTGAYPMTAQRPMTARRPMDGFIYGTGYGFRITNNKTENFCEEHIFLMPPTTDPTTRATIGIDSNIIDCSLPPGITDDNGKPHKNNYGIRVDASHVRIDDNTILNCAWGIMHRGIDHPGFAPEDFEIARNHITAATASAAAAPASTAPAGPKAKGRPASVVYQCAIFIDGHGNHKIPNVRIHDNIIKSKDPHPIKSYNLDRPAISNNH